ncbi:apolipoprotein N-acyltransferase [Cyanobium sp. CH-040]|uniref:apolipoprotein N-acyltransferase n=1 Tax=Cyanobium sp. CH-040 TaxID=2823708 RepID=UPI0020CE68BE|nr:apolipoprotein N-acyltransferase [Cyanobium sp. CH-040]MCP9928699.1 apolipoprotein N-acyltransferase [Cyanobium sp. CH-040]
MNQRAQLLPGLLRTVLLAALGGALAGGALPPAGAVPLLWLALALLWALAAGPAAVPAAACWGAVAVLVSHRWLLGLHPLDWIGVPLPLSLPLCWLLLLLISALGGALVGVWGWCAVRLRPARASSALVLALGWGLAEVLLARGPLFWIGLGGSALPGDRALAGFASLGGAGLVAALQLLIGWGLWRGYQERRRLGLPGLLAAVVLPLLLLHAAGATLLGGEGGGAAAAGAVDGLQSQERVLVLQPSIPTREKFQWASRRRLQRQLDGAMAEAGRRGADLVVLPEGALGLDPVLQQPAAAELLTGGFRSAAGGGDAPEQRSSLLRFAAGTRQPAAALDKHRVVLLGEWVPLRGLLQWSGLSAVGGVEPGPPSRLLPRPTAPIGVAICYEIADGHALAAASRDGALWLLASANLDPYPLTLQRQFEALAQLRAIESDRWLVSVANTGPSGLISPQGEVRRRLPASQPGLDLLTVPIETTLTPYARCGELPLLAVGLLAAGWHWRRP